MGIHVMLAVTLWMIESISLGGSLETVYFIGDRNSIILPFQNWPMLPLFDNPLLVPFEYSVIAY